MWIRYGYAAASTLLALVVELVALTTEFAPARCGLSASFQFAIVMVMLGIPLTFLVVLIGSIVGYWKRLRALRVEALLIAIGLVAIGIIQIIPHHDLPPGSVSCQFGP
jgi:hypothetical protein